MGQTQVPGGLPVQLWQGGASPCPGRAGPRPAQPCAPAPQHPSSLAWPAAEPGAAETLRNKRTTPGRPELKVRLSSFHVCKMGAQYPPQGGIRKSFTQGLGIALDPQQGGEIIYFSSVHKAWGGASSASVWGPARKKSDSPFGRECVQHAPFYLRKEEVLHFKMKQQKLPKVKGQEGNRPEGQR